jgi:putative DNA primase/helicase
MLYAPRGVGKTWVSLYMAWAAASGGLCIGGWSADRPWKVIYVDGEMPAAVLQERLALVAQGAGGDCDPDNLKILTPDIQEKGMPNLATPDGRAALEPYIADREVIIVDNLATLSRGGRENEAESWLPMQEWCLDMRRRGKSVVLIHHAGKSGQQRGTSAREDILDTVISLRKAKDYEPTKAQNSRYILKRPVALPARMPSPSLLN